VAPPPNNAQVIENIDQPMKNRITTVLEMIKFEHSIFALPFALTGALLAARYSGIASGPWPTARQILWIIVAMVGARSFAMTLNRIVDLRYDRLNPRTAQRALVTGALSLPFAWGFTIVSAAVLVFAASQLNRLSLELSPVALAILFFYSYTKRFTSYSHLVLGFCLGISPAAAWIAVAGSFDPGVLLLCFAVTLWVGGFDVIYACQDVEFDRREGLYSLPKRFGVTRALVIARLWHITMVGLLCMAAWYFALPWPAWLGIAVVAALLFWEHSIVQRHGLSRVNAAFFTVNGYISLLFLLSWGAAVAVAHP
jgi:4-hydroxybenzoate polyprenyltransferase